jgi:ABC-2 type transport system ATP-binding protein
MKLQLQGIEKRYNKKLALSVAELTIEGQDIIGLVGKNGAGKSTLLKIIMGLVKPEKGTILWNGNTQPLSVEFRQNVTAYLGKDWLPPHLYPSEWWAFIATSYEMSRQEYDERLAALAPFIGTTMLSEQSEQPISAFSSGNQQKIGLVGALLPSVELLILDEPFNFLDPPARQQLTSLLLQIYEGGSTSLLISSHDLGLVSNLCKRVVLVDKGKVMQDVALITETMADLGAWFAE